jgi:hypothetical protein
MVGKLGFVRSIPPLLAGACVWLGLLYPFFIAPGAFSPVRVGAMAGSQYIQAAIILASIGVILIWTFISRPRKSRAVEPWVPILGLSLCFIPVLISKPLQIARAAFFLIAGSPAMFSRLHDALESTDGKIFPAAKPGE